MWSGGITFNKGVSKHIFWLHFALENVSNTATIAILRINSSVDSVLLYETDTLSNPILLFATSRYLPFENRPFPFRTPAFPVKLNLNETKGLFLKVDNRNRGLYLPMYIEYSDKLLRTENKRYLVYGVYFGIFLFIVLFNVFLFVSLKDRIHLWYAAYVLSAIMFMIQDERFDLDLFPNTWIRYLENLWVPPFSLLMIGTGMLVMQLFVGQNRNNSRLYFPIRIVIYTCFSLSLTIFVLSAFDPKYVLYPLKELYHVTDIIFPISMIFLIAALIERIRNGERIAVYYLIAVLFMLIGALNFYLNHLGVLNVNLLKPNGVVVGLAFEVIFLSFLLTIRYNNLRREKEFLKATQQQHLADAMIKSQENERCRLAKDLHDGVGSALTGISLLAQNYFSKDVAQNPQEKQFRSLLLESVSQTSQEIRNISHDLMPKDLEVSGLIASISNLVDLHNLNNDNTQFDFIHRGLIDNIDKRTQIEVYRVVKELCQNVVKHAAASKATIQCLLFDERLELIVEDNGKGLQPTLIREGIGIQNVKSRIAYLRGKLTVDSSIKGTTFLIEIPLH
nr:7TM diverse intracellular signaling domain-containing protein [Segetibacter sp. 3557_3]